MTDENNKPTLLSALLAVQAEIPKLKLGKDATGQIQARKYRYLTLKKIMSEAGPLINKHGLVWQTFSTIRDGKPALRYKLTHVPSGEAQEDVMLLMLSEENSQGQGSALSYARRYAVNGVLDLVPDDEDDDGAQASAQRSPPKPSEIVPTEIKPSPEDRMLTDEELSLLLDAVKETPTANLGLLLASEGVDSPNLLTVAQGRRIFKKIGVK